MKKILIFVLSMFVLCFVTTAQNNNSANNSGSQDSQNSASSKDSGNSENAEHKFSYVNAKILKVYDHSDAYVVVYEKSSLGVGKVSIPKKWYKETPKKFEIREKPRMVDPYLTYITDNGSFYKVWLTIPSNRKDRVWGVGKVTEKQEGEESDTLSMSF